MPTVYIPQQPMANRKTGWMPDLSSAAEYGKLEYIFNGGERIYALPGPSLFKARKALENFNPEEDYILWPGVGDPASLFATMIALMQHDPEKITFLYWDRKRNDDGSRDRHNGFYVPCNFIIKEKR